MTKNSEENIKSYILCIRMIKMIIKLKICQEEVSLYRWAQLVYDMPKKITHT